jgi:hypothetical protein
LGSIKARDNQERCKELDYGQRSLENRSKETKEINTLNKKYKIQLEQAQRRLKRIRSRDVNISYLKNLIIFKILE